MKSNLFQAYTKIAAPEYNREAKYEFMYGAECCFDDGEDTELLNVDDYEKDQSDLFVFDEEEE